MVQKPSNNRQIHSNVAERFQLLVNSRSLSSVGLDSRCFETLRTIVHSLRKLRYQGVICILSAK